MKLTFIDDSSAGVLRAAAAYAVLDKAIDSVDGNSVDASVSTRGLATDTDRLSTSAVRGTSSIDQFSGRLGILAKAAAVLGPALIPIGAVGIAGVAGLASQLGFAAVGVGSLVVATRGLGDALKAVEKARLEPTVANLQAARDAMDGLAPQAQAFVERLQELRPVFTAIRNQAAAGWFPGLTEALDHFEDVAPEIAQLFRTIGETGGNLVADAAESLAGPEWAEFLDFVQREAPGALEDLGHSAGNLVHGLGELWMAFSPVNADFGDWLLDMSRDFDDWASKLSETDGFENFVRYLRENGPKVADAAAAIADAILQIAQAAAPLGGPVLEAITNIANAIAKIADSPLGTPIMAAITLWGAFSLAASLGVASIAKVEAAMIQLGVTSTATGAKMQSAIAGKGAGIGMVGLGIALQAPDYIEKLNQIRSGEDDVVEGMWEMFAASTPVGAAFELLGFDILDVNKEIGTFTKGSNSWSEGLSGNRLALAKLASGAKLSAEEIRGLTDAMQENRNAALTAFDAVTQYREALKAARTQADKNNAGIQGSSKAALENRNALSQLAGAWNNQSAAVRNNVQKFREARTAFIETAVAMGVPKRAARELADQLLELPRSKVIPVTLPGATVATAQARALQAAIDNLHGKSISIETTFIRHGQPVPTVADGGTIPGPRLPYGDKVHALLAPGEEVISNRYGQADRFRADRAAGRIPAYADGGTIRTRAHILPGYADGGAVNGDFIGNVGGGTYGQLGGGIKDGTWTKLEIQLAKLTERLERASRQLRMMEKALERQEKAIDKQREVVNDAAQAVQETLQKMAAFGDDIAGRLTKGLFDAGSDFGSVIGTLRGNQQAGNQWTQALFALQRAGLDGPALQALLQQADLSQLTAVASWSPEQIAQFEALFGSSTAATAGAGSQSAQAVFSTELAENRAILTRQEGHLAEMVDLHREATKALKAQEKYIQWLERRKDKLEEREKDNHKNHKRTADALDGVGKNR